MVRQAHHERLNLMAVTRERGNDKFQEQVSRKDAKAQRNRSSLRLCELCVRLRFQ